MTTAGALRIVAWSRRADGEPAHAFDDRTGIVFRSLCERERWTAARVPAEAGPVCPVCEQIVTLAAEHMAEVVAGLGRQAVPPPPDGVVVMSLDDVVEGELRMLWGDR
jgi:hypothetical protein